MSLITALTGLWVSKLQTRYLLSLYLQSYRACVKSVLSLSCLQRCIILLMSTLVMTGVKSHPEVSYSPAMYPQPPWLISPLSAPISLQLGRNRQSSGFHHVLWLSIIICRWPARQQVASLTGRNNNMAASLSDWDHDGTHRDGILRLAKFLGGFLIFFYYCYFHLCSCLRWHWVDQGVSFPLITHERIFDVNADVKGGRGAAPHWNSVFLFLSTVVLHSVNTVIHGLITLTHGRVFPRWCFTCFSDGCSVLCLFLNLFGKGKKKPALLWGA